METRRPNLIFRRGFGIEHHQFWVHSPLLHGLFYKPIDEAVTGLWASSWHSDESRSRWKTLQNSCCVPWSRNPNGRSSVCCKLATTKTKTQKPRGCSDGEWLGTENNKSAETVAAWWAWSAAITCAKKTTTHGQSRDQTLDFLRGSSSGRDKNGNLTSHTHSLLWLWIRCPCYDGCGQSDVFIEIISGPLEKLLWRTAFACLPT